LSSPSELLDEAIKPIIRTKEISDIMKRLLTALALATLIGSGSASATYLLNPNATPEEREYYDRYHTAINEFHTGQSVKQTFERNQIRQQKKARGAQHVHSTNPDHDVHVNGRYVGSDPDPRIRGSLRQDAGGLLSGN